MSDFIGDSRFKTEQEFEVYFKTKVAPFRQRLKLSFLGDIPIDELDLAVLVVKVSYDKIAYYRKRRKLTPYARQQLDAYVDRQNP